MSVEELDFVVDSTDVDVNDVVVDDDVLLNSDDDNDVGSSNESDDDAPDAVETGLERAAALEKAQARRAEANATREAERVARRTADQRLQQQKAAKRARLEALLPSQDVPQTTSISNDTEKVNNDDDVDDAQHQQHSSPAHLRAHELGSRKRLRVKDVVLSQNDDDNGDDNDDIVKQSVRVVSLEGDGSQQLVAAATANDNGVLAARKFRAERVRLAAGNEPIVSKRRSKSRLVADAAARNDVLWTLHPELFAGKKPSIRPDANKIATQRRSATTTFAVRRTAPAAPAASFFTRSTKRK